MGNKGILHVSARSLAKCNSTSAMKLTGDILSIVFSKEELAGSSVTGTVANIHLNKKIEPKKQLDPTKVECIKCNHIVWLFLTIALIIYILCDNFQFEMGILAYVQEKFPAEKNLGEIAKKTVKQKSNNAVRRNRDIKRLPRELEAPKT